MLLVDLPRGLQLTAIIGLAVIVPLVIALAVILQRGATATLTALLARIRAISPERRAVWRERLGDLDRQLTELHASRRTGSWRGILWVLASRLVTWTATLTLISSVGVSITPQLVLGVLSVGVVISWVSSAIPFGLGLADGGNYALFDLLGASGAHGAFVTMFNRVRSFAVAAIGFLAMAIVHTLNRIALARMHARLRALRDRADAPGEPTPD
jgi:hypothetical protein